MRLLTTSDADEARSIAARLSELNDERRAIEQAVQEAAEAQVDAQHNRSVVVVHGRGWHPGVIGIVAGRIKEKTGRPALVIAEDGDAEGNGKGSGRSIPGVDLGAAIIAARAAGLLIAGGGLKSGQVIGQSSRDGGEPSSEPVRIRHLVGTMLGALVDPGELRLTPGLPRELITAANLAPIPGLST